MSGRAGSSTGDRLDDHAGVAPAVVDYAGESVSGTSAGPWAGLRDGLAHGHSRLH